MQQLKGILHMVDHIVFNQNCIWFSFMSWKLQMILFLLNVLCKLLHYVVLMFMHSEICIKIMHPNILNFNLIDCVLGVTTLEIVGIT